MQVVGRAIIRDAAVRSKQRRAGRHAIVAEIKEFAASYCDEGRRYFLQLEECSLMTSELRTVCEALRAKIAADNFSN
jgi:hypothetical protein